MLSSLRSRLLLRNYKCLIGRASNDAFGAVDGIAATAFSGKAVVVARSLTTLVHLPPQQQQQEQHQYYYLQHDNGFPLALFPPLNLSSQGINPSSSALMMMIIRLSRRPTATTMATNTTRRIIGGMNSLLDHAIWLIKRTFQPSIIRKKRKTGFLVRHRTVGGRRTLKRRRAKGRWRLGGGI